jgi:predicted nuclease of predicted toxin-antitoxin system
VNGFLLDENLPYRLRFQPSQPIHHSSELGGHPSDADLWDYAKTNNFVIVTKDADFSDRILVSEPPPRVIHLRFGNLRRENFHAFLAQIWPRVEILLASNKLVNVYLDRLEAVS